jgi:hypothetical protein
MALHELNMTKSLTVFLGFLDTALGNQVNPSNMPIASLLLGGGLLNPPALFALADFHVSSVI